MMIRAALLLGTMGILLAGFPLTSWTQNPDESLFSVRGFGTVGGAYNHEGEAGFRRDITQPRGARNSLSTDLDSRFGLQLNAAWHEQWDATVQVLTRYGYDGAYRPELTWGFLRYRPDPDLEIRAGRLGWDVYLLSDSREVGYSYLWVRPPVEYYGHLQLSKITGVDGVWRRSAGEGIWTHKVFAGEVTSRIPLDSDSYSTLSGSWLYGGYVDYQRDGWLFRGGLTRLELKTELRGEARRQLDSLQTRYGSELDSLLRLTRMDVTFHIATLGVAYDRGPIQAQLMYSYTDGNDNVSDMHSGYVSLGYRLGRWTPYIALAAVESEDTASNPLATPAQLPEFADIFSNMGDANQHTVSLGARYDWSANIALKLQADRVTVRNMPGSALLWSKPEPGWRGRTTVLSATVDFVF